MKGVILRYKNVVIFKKEELYVVFYLGSKFGSFIKLNDAMKAIARNDLFKEYEIKW